MEAWAAALSKPAERHGTKQGMSALPAGRRSGRRLLQLHREDGKGVNSTGPPGCFPHNCPTLPHVFFAIPSLPDDELLARAAHMSCSLEADKLEHACQCGKQKVLLSPEALPAITTSNRQLS